MGPDGLEPSENKDDYVFPYLKGIPKKSKTKRQKIKNEIKNVNKYLKRIGEDLQLPFKLTTYVGRHTFTTIMLKNGASLPTLKSSLGHSSIITTEKYIGGLPLKDLEKLTDKLIEV